MRNIIDLHKVKLHNSGKPNNKTQIIILLTDGDSNVDKTRTLYESELLHDAGITIIVIGKPQRNALRRLHSVHPCYYQSWARYSKNV